MEFGLNEPIEFVAIEFLSFKTALGDINELYVLPSCAQVTSYLKLAPIVYEFCFRWAEEVVLLMTDPYIKHLRRQQQGNLPKGKALSELSQWIMEAIVLAYSSKGLPLTHGVRVHPTWGANVKSLIPSSGWSAALNSWSPPHCEQSSCCSLWKCDFLCASPHLDATALHFPTALIFDHPHHPHLYWINTTLSPRHHQCL